MNAIYDSHILKWKNVNWRRDGDSLLDSIKGCNGREVLARARQQGMVVEVTGPNGDFANRLRDGKLDLDHGFDLEVITRDPGMITIKERVLEKPSPDEFIDRGDYNSLQWNGERGTGEVTSSRVRSSPMFFRANGMTADLVDLYAGRTLFLVLNGSSLEGFDWGKIKKPGICSLGVNNGAHAFRPNFWTCVDDPTRFMRSIWADPTITKFVPMAHFQKPIWDAGKDGVSKERVKDFPNVFGYRRNEAFQAGQWLFEDTINWGNHSKRGGGRSVMLAALRIAFLLGFRRVCLLGCDFYMDESHRYWFAEERTKHAISNNQNSYRLMMRYFEELQPHFVANGFHVVNCNPKSHLKAFPQADLEMELKAAEVDVSAPTQGMYVDRYKAQKQTVQPPKAPPKTIVTRPSLLKPAVARPARHVVTTMPPPARPAQQPAHMGARTLAHMVKSLEATPFLADPFAHLEFRSVFPDDVYQVMMQSLPESHHYHELRHADAIQPDGKSARLRFGFSAREIGQLPRAQQPFWLQMKAALHDHRLEKVFRKVFSQEMSRCFGKDAAGIKLRPQPELIRDFSGYRIGVHTDIPQKVFTVQFYLAADASQRHMGTTYYRRSDGEKGFDVVKRLDFAPCSGHAFFVCERSFHGVDVIGPGERPRNSLMLTYYLKEEK